MLVLEPTLLLGKVKRFQARCVSAQGVRGSCPPSQRLGQPRRPARSDLSLSLQQPWPKRSWMKVCSTGPLPTAEQTEKLVGPLKSFKK